jgi:NAD(P)-dependent dehydrogenase (short-subunit alcohol dehydrogenase family)
MVTVDFSGRTVLITGSSRGVGRATAGLFARAGARVCVHYNRSESAAREVLTGLDGGDHALLQADLGEPDRARDLVERAIGELGHLDILINNAGIFRPHPVDGSLEYAEWMDVFHQTLHTNLIAPAAASYAAIQHMRGRGGGTIVNVGSRGAYRGEEGQVG